MNLNLIERLNDWLVVSRIHINTKVVIDTSGFLNEQAQKELGILLRLNLYIPTGVYQQINRMVMARAANGPTLENLRKTQEIIRKMVEKGKWRLLSSRGSRIVPGLRKIEISHLDSEFQGKIWTLVKKRISNVRYQGFNDFTTLEDLLGVTDLRVIAGALYLQQQKGNKKEIILFTKDKMMSIVAVSQGVSVKDTFRRK